ncbi:hypothetical protein CR513_60627, partial [Mucuna pruriens]
MFLVVLTPPKFDSQGNELLLEKFGVSPFATREPAERTSVNIIARTMETKAVTLIKSEIIRKS